MDSDVNLVTLEILSFFDIFGKIFKHRMRKRFAFFRLETCTRRRVDVYTLDVYNLEPKRIVKFLAMLL